MRRLHHLLRTGFLPRHTGQQPPHRFYTAKYHALLQDCLFCVLRARRGVAAVAVGIQVLERSVIR